MYSGKPSITSKSLIHKVLKIFKEYKIEDKKLILAISGGVDSMVLMDLVKNISRVQNLDLHVVYVHHGDSNDKNIEDYRNQANNHVAQIANMSSIPFISSKKPTQKLSSEEDFRNFRYSELKRILEDTEASGIVLAHTSDDVLETRFIHLMRGSGEKGFQSIQIQSYFSTPSNPKKDKFLFRPFLFISKKEIQGYAREKEIEYVEDPSNQEDHFLRNWLRHSLFPLIEEKRSGSISNLSRSFSQISSLLDQIQEKQDITFSFIHKEGVSRNFLLRADPALRRHVLASYMHQNDLKNYSLGHINEILKQVSRKQKKFHLKLLNRTWYINENFISLQKNSQGVKEF